MANSDFPVSLVVFNRMALYARRLRDMKAQGCVTVSSVALA
ncbi:MAG: hypothetical protein LBB61_08775, partial [Treponema sp.]|nr:hypothetical protein [Treponema sp.]